MKRMIIPILGLIFLIGFVSALNITAGDPFTFSIGTTKNLYWDVVGNSSDLIGLNITKEVFSDYSNITITTEYWYKPDNFTLIFFDIMTEEVIVQVHSGSSSGGTKYIDRDVIIEKEVEVGVDKIIYLNKTIYGEERESEEGKSLIVFLIPILGFIAGLIIVTGIVLKRRKNKAEGIESEEEEVVTT